MRQTGRQADRQTEGERESGRRKKRKKTDGDMVKPVEEDHRLLPEHEEDRVEKLGELRVDEHRDPETHAGLTEWIMCMREERERGETRTRVQRREAIDIDESERWSTLRGPARSPGRS